MLSELHGSQWHEYVSPPGVALTVTALRRYDTSIKRVFETRRGLEGGETAGISSALLDGSAYGCTYIGAEVVQGESLFGAALGCMGRNERD